jgi:hypothetical protein
MIADSALEEFKAKGVKLIREKLMVGQGNWRIAFIGPSAIGKILFELSGRASILNPNFAILQIHCAVSGFSEHGADDGWAAIGGANFER